MSKILSLSGSAKMQKGFIGFLFAIMFLLPTIVFADTETITWGTQENDVERINDTTIREKQAQSFQFTNSGTLETITFHAGATGGTPTDNLIFSIYTDNAGEPSATLLGSESLASASWVQNDFNTITFSPAISLTAATTYWVVVERDGGTDAVNYIRISYDTTEPYADGVKETYVSGNWTVRAADIWGSADLTYTGASTSSTATSTTIIDPNRDYANGLFLFLLMFFGIYWMFSKRR